MLTFSEVHYLYTLCSTFSDGINPKITVIFRKLNRSFFSLCFLLAWPTSSIAQNLIIDGSFEDTILYSNGFVSPKQWDINLASPDYFSRYEPPPFDTIIGVPINNRGIQEAQDGSAYFGIGVLDYQSVDYREYLQGRLSSPLVKDQEYLITFWISLADKFHLAIGSNQIGVAISQFEYFPNSNNTVKNLNFISSDSAWDATDKDQWQRFQCSYKAFGNEQYILLGCFLKDDSLSIDSIGGTSNLDFHKGSSYYYIDNFSCNPIVGLKEIKTSDLNIYPNPFSNKISLDFGEESIIKTLRVFSIEGKLLLERNNNSIPLNEVDLSALLPGVYFIQFTTSRNKIFTEKIIGK